MGPPPAASQRRGGSAWRQYTYPSSSLLKPKRVLPRTLRESLEGPGNRLLPVLLCGRLRDVIAEAGKPL